MLTVGDALAHRALEALVRAESSVRRQLAADLERRGLSAAGFSALVVLTTARAIGEYGAVSVVSGNVEGRTQTLTLYVQGQFENNIFDLTGAYAASVLLALVALATVVGMTVFKPREGS